MAPPALSVAFCTEQDVQGLLGRPGSSLALDDDGTGAVSAEELSRLTGQGVMWATALVCRYCVPRYDVADLAASWDVNEWATKLAAYYVRTRLGNPPPQSLKEAVFGDGSPNNPGVMGELKAVKAGRLNVGDVGSRSDDWPTCSSFRIDHRYRVAKQRVERPLSVPRLAKGPPGQRIDWTAEFLREWW